MKALGIQLLPKLAPAMRLLRQNLRNMGRHLDSLGEQLDKHGGPWITGSHFTLADVSWMVILDRLVEADWDAILWGDAIRPSVSAYWQRLEDRESYRSQVLDLRCPLTRAGMAEVKKAKADDAVLKRAIEGI